jgi:parvulin-like peptidyl-prolyl isomerase
VSASPKGRAVRLLVALTAALAACSSEPRQPAPEPAPEPPPQRDPRVVEASGPALPVISGLAQDPPGGFSPAILLPAVPAEDAEIARAGALSIKKSHVCDRFLDSDPTSARKMIDVLVLDALIAQEATRYGIAVDAQRVQALADADKKQLEKELAGRITLAQYLERERAMTEAEYRRWLVLNLARKLYREYVARYSALLQDRVQVRYLVSDDKSVVEDARKRAVAGADFASLAIRWSEDDLRSDGGLLPPFGRGFAHPVAGVAFQLEPGQVSEPVAYERKGAVKWYLVYCLRKIPRRNVTFAEVHAELDRAIEEQPMTPFEFDAFYLQLRAAREKLPSEPNRR